MSQADDHDDLAVVEQAAAAWDARLRAPGATDADRSTFLAWRDADALHAETFDRLQAIYGALRAAGARPELRALRDEGRARARQARMRRLRWWGYGGAAAAAAAVALIAIGPGLSLRSAPPAPAPAVQSAPSSAQPGAKLYATALNERSTVTLDDGSTVTLDSGTRIAARFEPGRRWIDLLEGQALFRAAKDPARPFTVRAGDRMVTALGTVFGVRLDAGKVRVTLVEGRVAVRKVGTVDAAAAAPVTILQPRQQLIELAQGQAPIVRIVDVDKATSWTDGRVFFEDEPLGRAAAEMNRYSSAKIVVADPKVADLRINGMFRAGNQTGFVGAVQASLPVDARADDQGRILLERRAGSSGP